MELAVLILAVLGFVAVLLRFLKAALAAASQGANALYAREMQATRARRGDVTGMEEARGWVVSACKGRTQAIGAVMFWIALLALPLLLLRSPAPVYAAYSVLWLRRGAKARSAPPRP
jgi:hypothetical protein